MGGDKVLQTVAVHVPNHSLPSDAGITVGLIRDKLDLACLSHQLEPVDHGPVVPAGSFGVVRPVRLAGDDVLEPVAVDIEKINGMQLAEGHTVTALLGLGTHNQVSLEGNATVFLYL